MYRLRTEQKQALEDATFPAFAETGRAPQGVYSSSRARPLVVGPLELGVVTLDRPVQRRLSGLARAVDGRDVRREANHGTAIIRFEA